MHLIRNAYLFFFLFLQTLPVWAETRTGYIVFNLDNGKILAEKNADEPFSPASVTKLPSTLGLLKLLGSEKRFSTIVFATGSIEQGIIKGNLVLQGGADPMLDLSRLMKIAATLAQKGIWKVEGNLQYDASFFPLIPEIDTSQPRSAAYNPALDALSLNFNRYEVLRTGQTIVGKSPPLKPMPIPEDAIAAILRTPLPAKQKSVTYWLPVRDPALYTAQAFHWALAQNGITAPRPTSISAPPSFKQILSHTESAPAIDILQQALFYSNNMIMETMAMAATGMADLEDAAQRLQAQVEPFLHDIPRSGLELYNASGLTASSRMTPRQCAAFVQVFATSQIMGHSLRPLLPPLLLEPFATRDTSGSPSSPLRAKSGTINYARALAGITQTQGGQEIVFCVMSHDPDLRTVFDALSPQEKDSSRTLTSINTWKKEARETENALILDWMSAF